MLSEANSRHLTLIAGSVAARFLSDEFQHGVKYYPASGVVIAGFGAVDVFPSYVSYEIAGIMNGRMKFRQLTYEKIGHGDENSGAIEGFAQAEDVANFMDGIHPRYRALIGDTINRLLADYPNTIMDYLEKKTGKQMKRLRKDVQKMGEELGKAISEEHKAFRILNFSDPIITTISGQPKDELARVAENLVNLPSIRQRYSPGTETVGGPIDVAVISKGDGFIWINRKHYFEAARNPQYFAKSYVR